MDNQACAGAKAAELLDPKNPQHLQLDSLSDDTDYVTIGIGGNDIGFMPVVGACGLPEPKPCDDALDGARTALSSLGDSLDRVYRQVAMKAPNARVAVVGYPHLFDRYDCSPYTDFTRTEIRRLNAFADRLSQVIETHARQAGFEYVDVRDDFAGHAICTARPFINGFIAPPPPSVEPLVDSFHPNRDGYAAYAREVIAELAHRDRGRRC